MSQHVQAVKQLAGELHGPRASKPLTKGASTTGRRRTPLLTAVAAVPLVGVAVAGCGGGGGATGAAPPATTAAGQSATSGVASNGGLGKILVDSQGRTLYLFQADHGTKSACSGPCAGAWPPLRATGKPSAGSGISAAKLTTAPRSDGKRQVVYNGHPLYRLASDQTHGDASDRRSTRLNAS